jgi:hypothetical protein
MAEPIEPAGLQMLTYARRDRLSRLTQARPYGACLRSTHQRRQAQAGNAEWRRPAP